MTNYPCSDPTEADLRQRWYDTKRAVEVDPSQDNVLAHARVHRSLSDYLWNRTLADVEADRRRHPKAKRNLPKPADVVTQPGGRALP